MPLQVNGSDPSDGAIATSVSRKNRYYYDLSAESCVPSIVTSDWRDVFEQHPVVDSLARGGADGEKHIEREGAEGAVEKGPMATIFWFGEELPMFSFGRWGVKRQRVLGVGRPILGVILVRRNSSFLLRLAGQTYSV